MGKKRTAAPSKADTAVSLERAARLYRLLRILAAGPKIREVLLRRLRVDIRTFYRDLDLLRQYEITIILENRRYTLADDLDAAANRLPCPNPNLTLGEVRILAKGRTQAHQKLKRLLHQVVGNR
jgi:hypothetical protein